MMISPDPGLPGNPPAGYLTELVNKLYILLGKVIRTINLHAEAIVISIPYDPNSADRTEAVLGRPAVIKAIHGRVTAAGTDAGAVTAVIRKVQDGAAITAGTALHTGTFNLKGTPNTVQELGLAVSSDDLKIAEGHAIAIDFTGILTAATGVISLLLEPA